MGIRILRLQVWQRQYRGSRGTTRTATPGTRTGSSSFFSNIHMIHVYMPIFQWESEFRVEVWQRSCICITYIFEKMNNSLSWSLGLLFSLFTWTLDITFVTLVTSKFGFILINWYINMYHMYIWKKWTTPCPGPWGCRSRCSPGPSTWPLSHL